jgi:alanine racemase
MIAAIEIDLGALRCNVEQLARLVAPCPPWPVIKANAYGHGLLEVGRALAPQVAGFCVYEVGEGLALREGGVECPILVLGPVDPGDLEAAHLAHLTVTLWDTGSYRADAARIARRRGAPLAVHAKVDTGVTRFGFDAPSAAAAIADLLDDGDLRVHGVFTHLAAVEELESLFTFEQLARFERALAPIDGALRERGVRRHAAASAAAILIPQSRLDLVRPGIATFGIWPSLQTKTNALGSIELEAALSWHTQLVAVREVEAGRSVGYGCTYHTTRASRIAVIPIGYAEGIPRAASNTGAMLVHGKRAPIVGRVCMNVTMIDVTEIPQAQPGSRATLIGRCGEDVLTADDWGGWCDTISYEIVARLPANVPRRYVMPQAQAQAEATATQG